MPSNETSMNFQHGFEVEFVFDALQLDILMVNGVINLSTKP